MRLEVPCFFFCKVARSLLINQDSKWDSKLSKSKLTSSSWGGLFDVCWFVLVGLACSVSGLAGFSSSSEVESELELVEILGRFLLDLVFEAWLCRPTLDFTVVFFEKSALWIFDFDLRLSVYAWLIVFAFWFWKMCRLVGVCRCLSWLELCGGEWIID